MGPGIISQAATRRCVSVCFACVCQHTILAAACGCPIDDTRCGRGARVVPKHTASFSVYADRACGCHLLVRRRARKFDSGMRGDVGLLVKRESAQPTEHVGGHDSCDLWGSGSLRVSKGARHGDTGHERRLEACALRRTFWPAPPCHLGEPRASPTPEYSGASLS